MSKTTSTDQRLMKLEAQFTAAILRGDTQSERVVFGELKAFDNTKRAKPPGTHENSHAMPRFR